MLCPAPSRITWVSVQPCGGRDRHRGAECSHHDRCTGSYGYFAVQASSDANSLGAKMKVQTLIATLGMIMGLVLMLLTLRATTPREFLPVGAFLLVAGFCKILKVRIPKL